MSDDDNRQQTTDTGKTIEAPLPPIQVDLRTIMQGQEPTGNTLTENIASQSNSKDIDL